MAKAVSKRPMKVFRTRLGFFDTVVAAPSQAAALRAWGVHQNLFANGQADIADDGEAVTVALGHPEVPLRRAVGSTDAFALEPAHLPIVPDAPKRAATKPGAQDRRAIERKPIADRSRLDAAEAALCRLDDHRKTEEADFRRRQGDLDAARAAAQAGYAEARTSAAAAVATARAAYRTAGGSD